MYGFQVVFSSTQKLLCTLSPQEWRNLQASTGVSQMLDASSDQHASTPTWYRINVPDSRVGRASGSHVQLDAIPLHSSCPDMVFDHMLLAQSEECQRTKHQTWSKTLSSLLPPVLSIWWGTVCLHDNSVPIRNLLLIPTSKFLQFLGSSS